MVRLDAGTVAALVLLCGLFALAALLGLLEALVQRHGRSLAHDPLEPVALPPRVTLPPRTRQHQPLPHLRRVK